MTGRAAMLSACASPACLGRPTCRALLDQQLAARCLAARADTDIPARRLLRRRVSEAVVFIQIGSVGLVAIGDAAVVVVGAPSICFV